MQFFFSFPKVPVNPKGKKTFTFYLKEDYSIQITTLQNLRNSRERYTIVTEVMCNTKHEVYTL